jgi:uncharacterized membrane protein
MSDRAVIFLFSLLVVIGSAIADAWLFATNQIATFDGLFLFCSSCVIVFAFGLYLRWLIRSAVSKDNVGRSGAAAVVKGGRAASVETSAVLSDVH